MSLSYKFAITTAVAYSALSLYDAVHHGILGRGSIFSDEYGTTGASLASGVLSALTFAALAAVLVTAHAQIDRGSRTRCWIRRLFAIDLATLAAIFTVGTPFFGNPESAIAAALGVVAGIAFAAMFVLAFALGVSLLRVRELRASVILLVAVMPIVGLTFALNTLASAFAHPAYAETAIYLGVALLGRRPAAAPNAAPADTAQVSA